MRKVLVFLAFWILTLVACDKERVSRRGVPLAQKGREGGFAFDDANCRKPQISLSLLPSSGGRTEEAVLAVHQAEWLARLPKHSGVVLQHITDQVPVRTYEYRYTHRNLPVCELQTIVRTVNGKVFVSGEPAAHRLSGQELGIDPTKDPSVGWPQVEDVIELIAADLEVGSGDIKISRSERCVAIDIDRATLALDMDLDVLGHNYSAMVEKGRVRSLVDQSLHATARIFSENAKKSNLVDVEFEVTSGDGSLSSSRFKTQRTDGIERVSSTDLVFVYAPETPQFEEISAYVYAEKAAAWFSLPAHRYQLDCTPITIELAPFVVIEGKQDVDNATYLPPRGGNPPKLVLAPGGKKLANLRRDYDVIAHELGHHVVSRKLGITTLSEGKEIHEGLADYLVYASTGETCLGESVKENCGLRPTGGKERWVEGAQFYSNGTALALTLWSLRNSSEFKSDIFDAMVFMAIDGLRQQSGYNDLIRALLVADLALNQGSGACKILNTFLARGFGDFAKDISCGSFGS